MAMKRSDLVKRLFENAEAAKRGMYGYGHAYFRNMPIPRAPLEVLSAIKYMQPVSSKEIASKLSLTPGAVSQSVEALDQEGYVVRKADVSDRRIQYLALSKKGEKLLADMDKQRLGMMEEITQDLTVEELEVWLNVQTKMAARLKAAHLKQQAKDLKTKKEAK
jgi:MarR family 2-MHQ and catechol resistance regulon transcriptional repressor